MSGHPTWAWLWLALSILGLVATLVAIGITHKRSRRIEDERRAYYEGRFSA